MFFCLQRCKQTILFFKEIILSQTLKKKLKAMKNQKENAGFQGGSTIKKVSVNQVVIPNEYNELYDYQSKNREIELLQESISEISQQQAISVIKQAGQYLVIDGVLRLEAIKCLNLNIIKVVEVEFDSTENFSLKDLIIHHQIKKEKTPQEKLNEIKSILRIDEVNSNPLRDKEKRNEFISKMMGNGWKKNNVLNFEKILYWDKETPNELSLPTKILLGEVSVAKSMEAISLFNLLGTENENESQIIKGFLDTKYDSAKAEHLIHTYFKKKEDKPTEVKIYPIKTENYEIISGNIERIKLPSQHAYDAVFTSPPFYKMVRYGDSPDELGWEKTPQEYVERLANILMIGFEKMKDSGSMFINITETFEKNQCYGIIPLLTTKLMRRGVLYQGIKIWNKTSNKPLSNKTNRLLPGFEYILHFTKTTDYYFERFKKPKKSNTGLKVTKGCKEKSGNSVSYHIPNDYDQFRDVLHENEVGDALNVSIAKHRTVHTEDEQYHPATFSYLLPVIPLITHCPKSTDSVVFDPFMGSGSTGRTSLLLGYKFVGVELYEENIKTAKRILHEGESMFDQESLDALLLECAHETELELDLAA
jgi:DNA modification methylase